MVFSRFRTGVVLRTAALVVTVVAVAEMLARTHWHVTVALGIVVIVIEVASLVRFEMLSSREMARFLDAVSFDDGTQRFTGLLHDAAHSELGAAISRVVDLLRVDRAERETQARYLQTLLAHVPVALITVDENRRVQLLNRAARRLFESPLSNTTEFIRYGESFAAGLETLHPGGSAIIRMERNSGTLQLKVAATDAVLGGLRQRLVSLQNIENEMSAQELAAWQTVVRIMAHEMMNSLTPVSSLTATARDLVADVLTQMPEDDTRTGALRDARDALETVARRSEGLLHFVQSHRRLTKPLVTQIQMTPLERVFARMHRLLAAELTANEVVLVTRVEPQSLELAADTDLLDQALINLLRNAIEALSDAPAGKIELSGTRDSEGRICIAVADNGPGIAADHREKVFVPFFTTKRHGSGVGLTLVRQIATAHSATVDISQTPGGGATIRLRL